MIARPNSHPGTAVEVPFMGRWHYSRAELIADGIVHAVGIVLAMPWSKLLADPNLRTRAHDPMVFVPVLLLVLGVSVLAALVPLLRALRVDPAVALRYE